MENISTKKLNNQRSLVDELIEDKDFDQTIIKTFYSKDELSSDIFDLTGTEYKMHEGVRDKLLNIANAFVDFLGISFFIYDVVLTGSLANYNWSEYSDVDLHILIDTEEINDNAKNRTVFSSIMKDFFKTKKDIWNDKHNIKIKGYDVEVYIQDISEKNISSGIYSVLNNKWNIMPEKGKAGIDDEQIMDKGAEYAELIDDLEKKNESGEDISTEITQAKDKLKKFRQSGLERGGEYSYENLTFKLLRRNGYITKLMRLKKEITDKKLSVRQ